MSGLDFSQLNVPLHELQAYVEAELEAQRQAKKAEAQAYRDKLLEEQAARAEAERQAEAAARAAGDPNAKAARTLAELLGDDLSAFIPALNRVNPAKFVTELLKLHGQRVDSAKREANQAAHQVRADAHAAAEAVLRVRVDSELARLGVTDVTPDEDEA